MNPSPNTKAEAFMEEFERGTVCHPFSRHLRIFNNNVVFEVKPFNNTIRLSMIQAIDMGKGHASSGLDWLTALARQHSIAIQGSIDRQGRDGLRTPQLRSWYKRHGFNVAGNSILYSPAYLLADKARHAVQASLTHRPVLKLNPGS